MLFGERMEAGLLVGERREDGLLLSNSCRIAVALK